MDPHLLSWVNIFELLYLIGKILGDTLPLKLITSKCLIEWKATGDVDLVDIGKGFYLVKFPNVMYRNFVLRGQPWFMGGQILPPILEQEL